MQQPTQGGSYIYEPEKDELTQVEKPTVPAGLHEKPKAPAKGTPRKGN
jgi:hypothetical protein